MSFKAIRILKKTIKPRVIITRITLSLVVMMGLIVWLPWQQFAIGDGKVIAYSPTEREHTVNSPIDGRIKKWYVDEGMSVKKNDLIVEISDNDPQLIVRLSREQKAVALKIQAIEKAIAASKMNVVRQKNLYDEGINSRRQYELAQMEVARYETELAQAKVDEININVRIARQQTQVIKAHTNGIIFKRLSGQESVVVKAGEILAQIIPETTSRAVALMVDGNDIPFVRKGQTARLQFEGWPAVQFRGWPEIAVGTFSGVVAFIDPTDNGQGLFRVVINPLEPWPDNRYLRQGARVHGWIQLGKVRLWYELWRQYNGFPPESAHNDEK